MIDHTGVNVSDFAASKRFYDAALAPLGYGCIMEFQIPGSDSAGPTVAGFGELATKKPDFWIHQSAVNDKIHIAFRAADRATVDAFHAAAMAAGGEDNGGPGPRPHYHANYYGAFVRDPDGHNIEAVCHSPA